MIANKVILLIQVVTMLVIKIVIVSYKWNSILHNNFLSFQKQEN